MGYDKNYGNYGGETRSALAVTMTTVYGWMTLALAATAIAAYYVSCHEELVSLLYTVSADGSIGFGAPLWILFIGEFALVWYLSARIAKLSFGTAATLFGIYSVLNGIFLSSVFLVYAPQVIYKAFFTTAGMFGVMSFLGYTTKKDLSGLRSLLIMALFGLIIGSVVNMFLHSGTLDYIITYAGVLVFTGLTAYDTQKIKNMLGYSEQFGSAGIDMRNIAIIGALSLYLDFINMFLYLLRIFGRARD